MAKRNLFACNANYADTPLFSMSDFEGENKRIKKPPVSPATEFLLEGALQNIQDDVKGLKRTTSESGQLQKVFGVRLDNMEESLNEVRITLDNIAHHLLPRKPWFTYTFVTEETVESLYQTHMNNPSRFAAALESLVYLNDPSEMQIAVNKREQSEARIQFIKNCLFYHFNVSLQLQDEVWKSVRVTLDGRASRNRRSGRFTPNKSGFRTSTPKLLDIVNQ
ncbi:unnamed protein product [Cylicocyclus nassatus]|uniref:Uncharacterized protein n=1 Tax=Cylicocyclus nassatus TaxID=53992 RepID=A0AA36MAX3_CYLNA|nr:unnamed protein product [Cylicocyclus nassatus]